MKKRAEEIEEYLDSMEEYEQKPRTSLTLQEYLPDKVLNGEINEESMKKYLPEERVDMLLEEWGKEEDEDTPTSPRQQEGREWRPSQGFTKRKGKDGKRKPSLRPR